MESISNNKEKSRQENLDDIKKIAKKTGDRELQKDAERRSGNKPTEKWQK